MGKNGPSSHAVSRLRGLPIPTILRPAPMKWITANQGFSEELEHIDLPVSQETPARSHDWSCAAVEDAAAQQRQQQWR